MWLTHSLASKTPESHPDVAKYTAQPDAAEMMLDSAQATQARLEIALRAIQLLWPGTVAGLLGVGVGCLAGAFVPGTSYRIVTIVVASMTALVIGWRLDRGTVALRRPSERSRN
jgi:hypothetical protein